MLVYRCQKKSFITFSLKTSICTKIQELDYKILTRWYYTPQLLHKYFPATTDTCWRCQADKGTLLHIFWSCPLLQHFWTTVPANTQRFTDHMIRNDQAFLLLHATTILAQSYKRSIVRLLLNAAKSCIPLMWKKSLPPSIGLWLHGVEEIKKLEDLVLTAQNKINPLRHGGSGLYICPI